MRQIKLTKHELERLLSKHSKASVQQVERLVEACKDLDYVDESDMCQIYNAFCKYLRADGLRVYKMSEFDSIVFTSNTEQKRLTANVDLDDMYFAINIYSVCRHVYGYESFNDLHSFLKYRIPLSLNQINEMLEYAFEDEEGEE